MGRKKAGDFGQHRQHGDRRCGACAHRRGELAQEQHRRGFTGVVAGLPGPGSRSVGAAKSGVHGDAQERRIDATTTFEMRKEKLRGPASRGRSACDIGTASKHADAAAEAEVYVMEVTSKERRRVEPQALSLDLAGSNPSRPRSSFDPSTNKGSDASASDPRVARDQAGCASG